MALEVAARGFYLSFSGLLLFNTEIQEAVLRIPADQILAETDSPALSPRPNQTRNEPAFVETIILRLAKLLQAPFKKTAEITSANTRRFYRLPAISKKIPPPRKG